MEARGSVSLLLLLLSGLVCVSEAYKFYVGGRDGWVLNPSENYYHWAERNRFQVNDSLVFKYKKGEDSVLWVEKEDYYSCNRSNPIKVMGGGVSVFQFNRSGPFYFISGAWGHCQKGQKLIVVVLAVRPKPPPAPAPVPPVVPTPAPVKPPSRSPAPSPKHHPNPPSGAPAPSPKNHPTPPSASPAPSPKPSPSKSPVSPSPAPIGKHVSPSTSPTEAPSPPSSAQSPTPGSSQSAGSGAPSPSPSQSSSSVLTASVPLLVALAVGVSLW